MDAHYPIEVLARSAATRFQGGFARRTLELAPPFTGAALRATGEGLLILAADERALSQPVETVRKLNGGEIRVSQPRVRYRYAGRLEEPVMWLRVAAPRARIEAVVQDLVDREARMERVDWLAQKPVVEARVRLRDLLGYVPHVETMTDGAAEVSMWLSHYAPVPPGPGHAA